MARTPESESGRPPAPPAGLDPGLWNAIQRFGQRLLEFDFAGPAVANLTTSVSFVLSTATAADQQRYCVLFEDAVTAPHRKYRNREKLWEKLETLAQPDDESDKPLNRKCLSGYLVPIVEELANPDVA
jgi:hypothetical protein